MSTIFTSTFRVANGKWKSLFEGRDYEYTYANYSMAGSGTATITDVSSVSTYSRNASGSEMKWTSQRTDWSTISGTKQTTGSKYRSNLVRNFGDGRSSDSTGVTVSNGVTSTNHATHDSWNKVSLVIIDTIIKDANGVQTRTYNNDATAVSSSYGTNNFSNGTYSSWCIHQSSQNAVLSKTDPLANYTVTNHVTNNVSSQGSYCGNQTYSETVDTCWMSLSGTGVNSHYTHAAITYVNSVELTFGANGAGITFGGPTVTPGGFTSENFDQDIPKPPPPPPLDMSGAFVPTSTPFQAFWGSLGGNLYNGGAIVALATIDAAMGPLVSVADTYDNYSTVFSRMRDQGNGLLYSTYVGGGAALARLTGVENFSYIFDDIDPVTGQPYTGLQRASYVAASCVQLPLTAIGLRITGGAVASQVAPMIKKAKGTLSQGWTNVVNWWRQNCFIEGTQVIVGKQFTEDGILIQLKL